MKTSPRNKTLLPLAAALLLATPSVQAVDNTGTGGTFTYTDSSGLNPVVAPPYIGGYVVHKFTSSGTLNIPVPTTADVLVVAGGGGGGKFGGGGGGGGFIYTTSVPVAAGNTTVTVGALGAGATVAGGTGGKGGDSQFGTQTAAVGGGGGGSRNGTLPYPGVNGATGGSGGGASASDSTTVVTSGGSAIAGQGNAGGTGRSPAASGDWGGGGGGGAGAAGSNATGNGASASGGKGGAGLANSISGASVTYAGGGGGATYNGATTGTAGAGGSGGGGAGGKNASGGSATANTGGGGGGGDVGTGQNGGAGGTGIVIVRYPYDPGTFLISLTNPTNSQIFGSTVSISATVVVYDGTPPFTANFYLDGNATPVSTTNNAPTTLTVNLGVLAVGSHTVEAKVTDSTSTTVSSGTRPFSVATDITAPNPNPMTFAVAPAALDTSSIAMTATTATDALSPPIQYYFENITKNTHSGWIPGTVWTNTSLQAGTAYVYRVKARDAALNETAFSATFTATTAYVPPVQTKVSSSTELAYATDVSNSDLLTGLTATTTGWNTGNSATPAQLNDGIHGGSGIPVQGAWTTVGATAIYHLGLGANGLGYTLTSIQTIAAWLNVAFGNQAYTVDVKVKDATNYTTLATVDYEPLTGNAAGATKVTLTDPSGVLATGVEFIRFTANSVNAGANAGAFVFREIDVFGVPTLLDTTPPTLVTLNPTDNATAVVGGANLVATFSENIAPGTGNITIKNLDTSSLTVIPVGDTQISITGAVLTINPTSNLASSSNYAIRIDVAAITDLAANSFAGISDDTTWKFTTGIPDVTPPTLVTLNPAANATSVPVASNLVATFSENIALGSGNITIKNLSNSTQTVIPVGDPQISVSGAVLTINPTADLAALKHYAIRIDPGAITDISANPFAGIANDSTWNFSSASIPLRIMCLGDSITAGYTDNSTWSVPFMFGYRSGLYTRLTNAGYNFKLVGGSTEPWTGISGDPTHGGTYTPALDLRVFGQDGHRGYGGQSISGTNSNVAGYIAADTPDVILLLIGINGIASGSPALLNTLVNTIVTAAPNAHLIVAQITPLASFNQDLYNYNIYIRDTLVPSYIAAGKKVSTVNLYSLFLTNPNDYTSAIAPNVLANGINHPDNPHYDLMAQAWFTGIETLGLAPNTFKHWITGFPGVGALTGFNDDPDGDGIPNGLENFFGTNPGIFSHGVLAGAKNSNTFTFTHPQNATPAADVSAAYCWSKDLATFHTAGTTDPNGSTVELASQPNTPTPGTTTVTATVTGTPAARLFVKVVVTQN